MAVRLPVILSQPARREASATDYVETIVATTLLIPGLDANLIGDLGTIQLGSTDHVCLLGNSRDLVLASFLELAHAQSAWQRLEQSGYFVDLAQDEAAIRASISAGNGRRKVYYYQLAVTQPIDHFLERCRQLLAAQQVNLVSIQWLPSGGNGNGNGNGSGNGSGGLAAMPAKGAAPILAPVSPAVVSPEHTLPAGRSEHATQSEPAERVAAENQHPSKAQLPSEAQAASEEPDQWSALDRLVDDLDAMDL